MYPERSGCQPANLGLTGHSWVARVVAFCVAIRGRAALRLEDKGHNQTVQTKDLSENENKNHTDEELRKEGGGGKRDECQIFKAAKVS